MFILQYRLFKQIWWRIKRFKNTFKFSNNDINNFILLLRKGVYTYENEWEKFNETSLPEEEEFYRNLNIADITDANYMLQKDFVETLKWKI